MKRRGIYFNIVLKNMVAQTEIITRGTWTSAQLLVTLLSKVKHQHMMHMYLYIPRSTRLQSNYETSSQSCLSTKLIQYLWKVWEKWKITKACNFSSLIHMEWRKCATEKFDESLGIKEMRCHLFLLFKVDRFKNSTWHSFFKSKKELGGI